MVILEKNHKTMIMNKVIIICFSLILLFCTASCQKNQLPKSPLSGTYIEMEKKTDTIVFQSVYEGQNPVFELKRGLRLSEGYLLPDYYSGYYNYSISQDSISLYWFLSSGSAHSWYFKSLPEQNKLIIGNFFKSPENNADEKDTLVFTRIK